MGFPSDGVGAAGGGSGPRLLLRSGTNELLVDDDGGYYYGAGCGVCFTSYNLHREWISCAQYALGIFDPAAEPDYDFYGKQGEENIEAKDLQKKKQQQPLSLSIVNLVPIAEEEEEKKDHYADDDEMEMMNGGDGLLFDPWTCTAVQIEKNITNMGNWIQTKEWDYVSSLEMSDDEAALIQSTVTSFTATTANEIESLRQLLNKQQQQNNNNDQMIQHRTGIVQILMSRLREEVADPFGKVQKQRSRPAVQIYHNPLQCKLTVPSSQQRIYNTNNKDKDDALDSLLMEEEDPERPPAVDQRFLPKRPSHKLQGNLLDSYDDRNNGIIVDDTSYQRRRPPSTLLHFNKKKRSGGESSPENGSSNKNEDAKRIKPSYSPPRTPTMEVKQQQQPPSTSSERQQQQTKQHPSVVPQHGVEGFVYTEQSELENEAAQLALLRQDNDYDAVQKMEERMVDVTSLIGQFADLVSSQSENVHDIHATTESAKKDVDTGKEQLVEAKERTQQSRHYVATAVTAMAIVLLFMNYVKP